MVKIDTIQNVFLNIIRHDGDKNYTNRQIDQFGDGDWQNLLDLSLRNYLFPPLYSRLLALKLQNIPPEFMSRFKNLYIFNLKRNLLLKKELLAILEYFKKSEIPAIPLKGPCLAQYLYGDIALRQTSCDIDLLIRLEKLVEAEELLRKIGYETDEKMVYGYHKFYTQVPFHKRSGKDAIHVELHWGLRHKDVRSHTERFWNNAKGIFLWEREILAPSNEDLLLYLVLLSMCDKEFYAKYLYDIHMLIMDFADKINWMEVINAAQKHGFVTILYLALKLSQELFHTPVPSKVLRSIKPNILKERLARLWINQHNILNRRGVNYSWYYFAGVYLRSRNLSDWLTITRKKIFLGREEMMWRPDPPASKLEYYSLYMKRLLKPLTGFFNR